MSPPRNTELIGTISTRYARPDKDAAPILFHRKYMEIATDIGAVHR